MIWLHQLGNFSSQHVTVAIQVVHLVICLEESIKYILIYIQIVCRAGIERRIVPFCAVAAVDVLNLRITRRDEFLQGIKVFDEHGDEIGQSKLVGARVVSACTAGRIFAATPILVIPPLVMHRFVIDSLFILFHRAFPDTFPLQAC